MSEEEKKAIEIIESTLLGLDDKNILLNLIEKQQKELDKKDKIIKEIDKLQEKNQVLKVISQNNFTNAFMESNYISKDKINSKIEEYEKILQSSIIKEDYKKEVEHIIRVLKELRGEN